MQEHRIKPKIKVHTFIATPRPDANTSQLARWKRQSNVARNLESKRRRHEAIGGRLRESSTDARDQEAQASQKKGNGQEKAREEEGGSEKDDRT